MEKINGFIYSSLQPDESQIGRIIGPLREKYGEGLELTWVEDTAVRGGFRIEIGSETYDWSRESRLKQLTDKWIKTARENSAENVIPLLTEDLENWVPEALSEQVGVVTFVGDGIANVIGLPEARYGEILLFTGGVRGMVQKNLSEEGLGCILYGDDKGIMEGSRVHRTGKIAGVPVGDAFLGRVVDALGSPIDDKGDIKADGFFQVENPAPGIIDRQPVNRPMETGLLAIDSMFPIGRGQRELIIGDRQTGKTAIAIDTILNQKGKGVICVYVAIGQKTSSVAQLQHNLEKRGAMEYTIIVCAAASEAAPLQYIAPYAGCSMAEYFMNKGKDVLIIYDDLSKHAIAYRALSLLLEKPPGREAYPGDVFYLHSRLLERSAHLSDEKGGGSMTALPIVETQAGDVSAYIPTNIISITDGQIFLESNLFFAGQRPAVNVGLSVSRVGGAAQTKAMKKATGTLRLDLAQYREMEVFTQFASDLDESTKNQLTYGKGLMQILRQPQYHPLSQHQQVIILVTALARKYTNVPVNEITSFRDRLVAYVEENAPGICREIDEGEVLTDEIRNEILKCAENFVDANC